MLKMSFVPDKSGIQLNKCLLISEEKSLSKVKKNLLRGCPLQKHAEGIYLRTPIDMNKIHIHTVYAIHMEFVGTRLKSLSNR